MSNQPTTNIDELYHALEKTSEMVEGYAEAYLKQIQDVRALLTSIKAARACTRSDWRPKDDLALRLLDSTSKDEALAIICEALGEMAR